MSSTAKSPKNEGTVFFRSLSEATAIDAGRLDGSASSPEESVYTVRLTTDEPVNVYPGVREILGHGEGEIRMDWLKGGNAPVLWMHDRNEQIGVIQSAEIKDNGIQIEVKLSANDFAAQKKRDIDAGILRNTSVGFRIHNEEKVETDERGETWRVTDWEPLEGSFVTIPADHGTGFGRSADKSQLSEAKQRSINSRLQTQNTKKDMEPEAASPTFDNDHKVEVIRQAPDPQEIQRLADDKVKAELARRDAIGRTGEKYKMQSLAEAAIERGDSVQDFNAAVLKDYDTRSKGVTTEQIGLSAKEQKRFSVFNVMDALASGNLEKARFEREVSDEVKKRQDRDNDNFAIPLDIVMQDVVQRNAARAVAEGRLSQRALLSVDSGGNAEAAKIVDNDLLDEMFIESLREDTVFLQRGVTMLGGLRGDVTIPIELTNPSMYWVGEDTEPTEGDYTLTSLALTYKTLGGRVPFTRKAFKQATPQVENLLTASMRRGVRIALDSAAINGAGSATVPEGVFNASGIGSVTTGGTLSYAKLLEFEEKLGDANANTSNAVGFTNSHGKGLLLTTFKNGTGSDNAIAARVPGDSNALDTDIGRVYIGNTIPRTLNTDKTGFIYGNPAAYFMAMWGGLELNIDLATKVATGGRVVRVFQDVDGRVMQAANFAVATDIA